MGVFTITDQKNQVKCLLQSWKLFKTLITTIAAAVRKTRIAKSLSVLSHAVIKGWLIDATSTLR